MREPAPGGRAPGAGTSPPQAIRVPASASCSLLIRLPLAARCGSAGETCWTSAPLSAPARSGNGRAGPKLRARTGSGSRALPTPPDPALGAREAAATAPKRRRQSFGSAGPSLRQSSAWTEPRRASAALQRATTEQVEFVTGVQAPSHSVYDLRVISEYRNVPTVMCARRLVCEVFGVKWSACPSYSQYLDLFTLWKNTLPFLLDLYTSSGRPSYAAFSDGKFPEILPHRNCKRSNIPPLVFHLSSSKAFKSSDCTASRKKPYWT